MTWFEFRSKVDEYMGENCLDPQDVELGLFALSLSNTSVENLRIYLETLDGGGVKLRLWVWADEPEIKSNVCLC